MTDTLIITEGSKYLRCGRVKVVGNEWTFSHDLRMTICCDCLTGLYIYEEIDFDVFRYCLSRIRSRERDFQKRIDKAEVFVNLEGAWFGKEQVISFWDIDKGIDFEELESKWNGYWQ